jgi:two-component system sensor histidine kinase PilS (NtrC family)
MRPGGAPSVRGLLRWVYLGRVTVAIVVFMAAAFYFQAVPPVTILIVAIAALATVIVTSVSILHTHVRGVEPGLTFLYLQALFDLALITTVVHVTEGPTSQFPALYILVIAVSGIMMPFGSSLLITSLASLLYLADIVWWYPVIDPVGVWLQIAVFVAVFIATGFIATRVRSAGAERDSLRQEMKRLRLEASDILRNITSGVVTVDGRLGIAGPDIEGRPLAELVGDRAPELLRAIATTQATRRKTLRDEGAIRGERSFPIGVTTTSLEHDGAESPSVTAIFTDISDQKRIEELHLRAGRLEAVAELSASLAHEIKNPLASIRSSVEQIADSAGTDDDERVLAQLVLRESDRLSRLLSEFLDFSRVQVTQSRPLDLGAVAERAAEVVRQHPDCPESAAIEVQRELSPLEGDEDLLHRVAVNLILNAVQAADGQTQVKVEVREARPGEAPPGVRLARSVLLRVSDDGPGVPLHLQQRLFEPFVTGRLGGSGLGLAIVQRAVEAHRGVILVDSLPGKGATFTVLIPTGGVGEVVA